MYQSWYHHLHILLHHTLHCYQWMLLCLHHFHTYIHDKNHHQKKYCTLGYKIFISFVATISGVDTTEEVPSSLLLSEQMVSECVVDFLYNFYSFAAFHSVWFYYTLTFLLEVVKVLGSPLVTCDFLSFFLSTLKAYSQAIAFVSS